MKRLSRRVVLEHAERAWVEVGGELDVPREYRVHARRLVRDCEELKPFKIGFPILPVVLVARRDRAHPWLEFLQDEWPGAITLRKVGRTLGNDHEMMQR